MHGYTYWLHRKEPAHLWLAVGAVGIVGVAMSTAMVYEAYDVVDAELWQRIMLACAALLLLGFHGFTKCMLEIPSARLDYVVDGVVVAMAGQALWPELVFGGPALERSVDSMGLHYFAREIAPIGVCRRRRPGTARRCRNADWARTRPSGCR